MTCLQVKHNAHNKRTVNIVLSDELCPPMSAMWHLLTQTIFYVESPINSLLPRDATS